MVFKPSPSQLITDTLVFPESPRWRHGLLWISDVHDYALKAIAEDGAVVHRHEVPGRPAGSGFVPDGTLLLATALDRRLLTRSAAGVLTPVADLSDLVTGLVNDLVVGADGRAWVGDTGFDLMTGSPRPGRILTFTLDEGPRVAAEGVEFPNGMVLSPDGRELIVNESTADRTSVFSVAPDGTLLRDRTLAEFGPMPDGLCLDTDGAVWVPLLRGGRFVRVSRDGRLLDEVDAAGRMPVSCTFGGPDREWLYLCSAETTMAELRQGRSRGFVHRIPAPAPGAGRP
ncbi:SMP-30/gluconolactonase/LRE family protein [Amycolatopsis rhabdoformis]|uniref:SMP-30/gluconolactonase/LRE family protein n=1 Tax=Amycolatopsis rhabdoformis TaxID=1448059 RepID=A0ABZ1II65_9PSEU|nr:SMP-30/gluconolactonase/LRE family protein [Amycolatopsis rhabdoformis]WSE34139.1 SMP-30/gluconolactonase/LRE family protein [Amycolatopsis rhabdoformis]